MIYGFANAMTIVNLACGVGPQDTSKDLHNRRPLLYALFLTKFSSLVSKNDDFARHSVYPFLWTVCVYSVHCIGTVIEEGREQQVTSYLC